MIAVDPLRVFEGEKLASPATPVKKPDTVSPSPELDPGEQASIGYNMMTSGLAASIPRLLQIPAGIMASSGAHAWGSTPVRGAKNIGDINRDVATMMKTRSTAGAQFFKPDDAQSFLGMFDIHMKPVIEGSQGIFLHPKDMETLGKIGPVVDSFIRKYELPKKGWTIDFRNSPVMANLRGGGWADPIAKKVVIPRMSKEFVLHELGHAADYGESGAVKKLMRQGLPQLVLGLIPAAYYAGDEMKKLVPGTIDDKVIEFTQRHGPGLALSAIAAHTLYPEAKASFLALHHIKTMEGMAAAKESAKKLLPAYGSYLLATLPIVAGFALAKKYYYDSKKKNEKVAGIGDYARGVGKALVDAGDRGIHVGREILRGFGSVVQGPDPVSKLLKGGENLVISPEFRHGALLAGLPALISTYTSYAHPGGLAMREKMFAKAVSTAEASGDQNRLRYLEDAREYHDWREQNPKLYSGLVGAGAALTGGVLAKVMSELTKVL